MLLLAEFAILIGLEFLEVVLGFVFEVAGRFPINALERLIQFFVDNHLVRIILLRALLVKSQDELENRVHLSYHLLRMAQVEAQFVFEDVLDVVEVNHFKLPILQAVA